MCKREFVFLYDYTSGGVWGFIRAVSEEDIYRKFPSPRFPNFRVMESLPDSMSEMEPALREEMYFDIDNLSGWRRRYYNGDYD
jgi:hypothetical protein